MKGTCLADEIGFAIEWVAHDSVMLHLDGSPEQYPQVHSLIVALYQSYLDDSRFIQLVPSYQSLLFQFSIHGLGANSNNGLVDELGERVQSFQASDESMRSSELHVIPTYYDDEVAVDLEQVARQNNLDIQALIDAHCGSTYQVYALGFLPGFAYLGFVPKAIATPRHDQFSSQVPAGSVAIADRQTAVYPSVSPGGWKLIGRTPVELYNNQSALLKVGDRVKFESIDRASFIELGGEF